MIVISKNIKIRALTFGLILVAGVLTSFISSNSHISIILVVPGLLIGLALTIPHFDKSRKQIIALLTMPIFMTLLWVFIMILGLWFGMITKSDSDKTGVIILGIVSSFLFMALIEFYYPTVNTKTAFLIIVILGIASTLLGDHYFLRPSSKEQYLGKMILIWEVIVGLGLTIFVRYRWMTKIK